MPPAKVKPGNFVEAFDNALSLFITQCIEAVLSKRLQGLTTKLTELTAENETLKKALHKQSVELRGENDSLKKLVGEKSSCIDYLECFTRSDNLIIRGLSEQTSAERSTVSATMTDSLAVSDSHQSVETTFLEFCRDKLKVSVSSQDVSIAHRLKAGTKDSARPIVVRFTNHRTRNLV